ncbi:alpha/beta fold hydrolase [Roseateles sp. DAIF2]|uniref:alpha/beta fold hydrolase n=1 Tax=Roseateles sp. DAIF2 TaxID=2714952 RepID=UPI0018A30696|nr:alpha/beta fold hydrolase [Roseateles sp. DAIF2]QPF74082.1 alpha/beta fold hydrolase [Roseateles sp. DAIF2]
MPTPSDTATSPRPAEREQWVELPQQGRIYTRRWTPESADAAAAPILLLHDSLGSVALWRDFPAALSAATGRSVIAYDRLGFGQSDARHDAPSLRFVAEEAEIQVPALLERLGIERFVAMGHSVGGGMAILCAAHLRARCEALVTIAAQVFAEQLTLQGIRVAKEQFKDAAQFARLARYHGEKARWVLQAWTETWLAPGFANWSLQPDLAGVGCPVLAIHGEQDEYGSPRHARLIGALSTGPARVEVLAGAAHMPHREQPERVLALIAEFLGEPAARA